MPSVLALGFLGLLLVLLGLITWHDARSFRIPDMLSLPLVALGMVASLALGFGLSPALWGAAAGYGSFIAIEIFYLRLRGREGLGRGDAKLAAAGGAWCGLAALPLIVTIAALSALLFVGLRRLAPGRGAAPDPYLPFAPFLSGAILVVFVHRVFAHAG